MDMETAFKLMKELYPHTYVAVDKVYTHYEKMNNVGEDVIEYKAYRSENSKYKDRFISGNCHSFEEAIQKILDHDRRKIFPIKSIKETI